MTDNDIIKALKCLCNEEIPCKDCAYKADGYPSCRENAAKDAFDLTNRQRAEIDELTEMLNATIAGQETLQKELVKKDTEIERLEIENQSLRSAANSYKLHYHEARAEAVREFAERLKEKCNRIPQYNFNLLEVENCIDNLVKEMVGDTE